MHPAINCNAARTVIQSLRINSNKQHQKLSRQNGQHPPSLRANVGGARKYGVKSGSEESKGTTGQ
eukprot:886748-Heterocapsa_arctica.AAC.1